MVLKYKEDKTQTQKTNLKENPKFKIQTEISFSVNLFIIFPLLSLEFWFFLGFFIIWILGLI